MVLICRNTEWGDPRIRDAVWKNIYPEPNTGCWLWGGYINDDGYGRGFPIAQGRLVMAHRITFEALVHPLAKGDELDHLCRVRACCNPEHLEAVTHAENVRRAAVLITQCPQGHEFTPENTRRQQHSDGHFGRQCKTCALAAARAQRATIAADPILRERNNLNARLAYARRRAA